MKKKLALLIIMGSFYTCIAVFANCALMSLAVAGDLSAQAVKSVKDVVVTAEFSDSTLKQVFEVLESKTDFHFIYDEKDAFLSEEFSMKKQRLTMEQLLLQISKYNKLSFRQVNNTITVIERKESNQKSVEVLIQAIPVTGRVTSDEDGSGLPGVNVIVKGTAQGTVTDLDGSYAIDVPDVNSVLVFSSVGFTQEEIVVGSRSVIDVQLVPDLTALEEIVVIGYGSKKKGELTSSVSTVSGEDIQKPTVQRIDQALQGQAAGVQVVNRSGRPGAPAIIRVRGSSTINDNSPLYVVDGVQTDNIENINPSDIESINILKDAGASIYGAQAANGVIIITTKSGKEGAPRLSFDFSYGFQKVGKIPEFMNTEQFTRSYNAARAADGLSLYWDLNNLPPHDTQWIDKMFQTAPISNNNVTLSGGGSATKYLVGINYMNQEGVMRTSGYERYNLRFNSDTEVGKKIRFGNTLTIGQENIDVPGGSEGGNQLFVTAIRAAPTIPIFWTEWDAENNPLFESRGWEVGDYAGPSRAGEHPGSKNVVGFIEEQKFKRRYNNLRIFGTLYGEYEPIDNLVFRTQFGGDVGANKDKGFNRSYMYGTKGAANAVLNETATNMFNYQWDNFLKYRITLSESHNISAMVGMNARRNYSEFMSVRMSEYVDEDLQTINAGTTIGNVSGSNTENTWISYFGRLNYDYQGKYYIQGIFRADGSSKFGTNNRFGYFPAVSGAWRVSQESFWTSSIFNEVKVRGSWGMTGNDRIPAFGYLENLDFNGYVFGLNQQFVQGVYPVSIANPDLKWETVVLTDFGLDLGMLGNRFTFTVDWYNKETRDMLLQKPITSSSGYSSKPWYNAGSMKTTGWDFELGYNDTFGDWRLNVSTNISSYKNEVLELGADNEIINLPLKTEVGEPINYFFGYVTDGLFQSQEEVDNHAFQTAGTRPGDVRFKDLNDDGVIDLLDRTKIGNPFPDMVYGFTVSVAYRGFDLSILASGVAGNEIYRQPAWGGFESANNRYNGFSWIADYWTPDNRHNDVLRPRATYSDPNGNSTRESDRYISDGSYLRLNNIQLGYTFDKSIIDKLGFNDIRLYVTGQNLLTFTDYFGFDPEVGGENFTGKFGVDSFTQYPPARIVLFGIKFSL